MPYNNFYGDGPRGFTEEFRMKYSIPDNVQVERVTTDRIPFGKDFIILPLFAFIEGGGGGGKVSNEPLPPLLPARLQPCAHPSCGKHLASSPLGDKVGRIEQHVVHLGRLDASVHGIKEPQVKVSYNFEWELSTLSLIILSQPGRARRSRDRIESLECEGSPTVGINLASTANAIPGPRSLYLRVTEAVGATKAHPIDQPEQQNWPPAKAAEDVEVLPSGLAEDDPANLNEPSVPFVPDFECSDKHVITVGDSLEGSPLLSMTLLKGLALRKDMENLPTGKVKNTAELCLFLAKVGQCANKVTWMSSWRLKDHDRLKEEKKLMEDDLPNKLEEAGDAGYNEAGEYYQQQVQSLVTKAFKEGELKGIKDTDISSFLRGYQVGLDYAEVPEIDHRREPPVVPPVELPKSLLPAEQPNLTTNSQLDPTDLAEA
ncbi:hypothetical protein RHSIM_Rhsim06G0145900 [Rhododendron simsii]|uniref:Uncharacterized protein n=1 Tax=Rhododendron simsii TaxID=118357 RepID=A0A834GW66_RHOSS|nr:hypothetical protein RHSIM_Rhsim06G0145900 [Rhododendron simsii]